MIWLSELAARPLSLAVATGTAAADLAIAVVAAAAIIVGTEIPDSTVTGLVLLVASTGFGLLGWFGSLVFRLATSTRAIEQSLAELLKDGTDVEERLRDHGDRITQLEARLRPEGPRSS